MTATNLEAPALNPTLVREIVPEYDGKNAVALILEATQQIFGKVVFGILPDRVLLIIFIGNEQHSVALDKELTTLKTSEQIPPRWYPLWAGGAAFGLDKASLKVIWANGSMTLGRELTDEMLVFAGTVITRLAREARSSQSES